MSITRHHCQKKSAGDFKAETRHFLTTLREGDASHVRLPKSVAGTGRWRKKPLAQRRRGVACASAVLQKVAHYHDALPVVGQGAEHRNGFGMFLPRSLPEHLGEAEIRCRDGLTLQEKR